MVSRIVASVVVVFALVAGAAYAATELASSDGTEVCVNETNGLMRASSTCRENEHAMTFGGEDSVVVTQNGTFPVAASATSDPRTLPLTGITVSGYCMGGIESPNLTAILRLHAASGATMDAVGRFGAVFDGQALDAGVAATGQVPVLYPSASSTVIATSNGATASITVGASTTSAPGMCKFIWQATEAPN